MGAASLEPPPGFVEDVAPPDGFVEDHVAPPPGFVLDGSPAALPPQKQESAPPPDLTPLDIQARAAGFDAPSFEIARAKELDRKLATASPMEAATMVAYPIPSVPQQEGALPQIGAALANTAIGAANFMASPLGGATALLPLAPAVVGRTASGVFAADMLSKNIPQIVEAPTLQGKVEAGLGAAMGLLAGAHAVGAKLPVKAGDTPAAPTLTEMLAPIIGEQPPLDHPLLNTSEPVSLTPATDAALSNETPVQQTSNQPPLAAPETLATPSADIQPAAEAAGRPESLAGGAQEQPVAIKAGDAFKSPTGTAEIAVYGTYENKGKTFVEFTTSSGGRGTLEESAFKERYANSEPTAPTEQPAPETQPQGNAVAATTAPEDQRAAISEEAPPITRQAHDFASVSELNGKPLDEIQQSLVGADTAEPEKAVAAMVQTDDGKVYFGANHSLAMAEAEADNPDLTTHNFSNVDSFVTSHGRIIGRDEAMSAFKKGTSQKLIEPPVTSTEVADHPTVETPLSEITLSKDVPQFKGGADEKGIVEPIAGKYERVGTPPVQLWERNDGSLELISGRHRLDLAQRTGEETIPSQIHREADGFSATDAAKLDAELNIRDEQGSTADYANYFKNARVSQEAAESGGLLARAKGRAGFAIAQNGSEDLFALHQSGRLTDAQAGAIADAAPKNEGAQQIGIRAALNGKSADYVSNLIKAVQARTGGTENAQTLDLFGSDDSAMREMDAQAKEASAIQGELRKTKAAITGASKDPERAKAEGVDVKDPAQVSARVAQINAELGRWENWPMHPDLVARTRGEAAPVETPKLQPGEEQGTLPTGDTKTPEQLTTEQAAKDADLTRMQQAQDVRVGAAKPLRASEDIRPARDMFGADKAEGSDLFDKQPALTGMHPEETIVSGASDPEQARQVSPRALGITHPLPKFIKDIADYFVNNTPSQIGNSIKGSIDATLGKTFSKTTIANREAGELGARWISSRIAAPHLANTFAANVLEGTGVDPVKFGAALTEDNLRSIKKSADDPSTVTTIIGAKGSPFKNESEYQSFLNDPATQTALQRHVMLWDSTINPMYRQAQLLDPAEPLASRGDQTGARINLYNDVEAKGKNVVTGTGAGNLTATQRRKSPFAITAKGTGQNYNVNYFDQMANTFGRQLEIANKNAFEQKLVDSGNAVIGKPGKDVTLPDGDSTTSFPLRRTTLIKAEDGSMIPVNQNIYVRKSLAGEYRRGADVDLLKVPALLRGFNAVVNRTALAGLTDASVHTLNLATALLTRPSVAGGVLSDSLLSSLGRLDVFKTMWEAGKKGLPEVAKGISESNVPFTTKKAFPDWARSYIPTAITRALASALKENQSQLAELAEIGALKNQRETINPLGKVIQWADKTTRLVLDDAFKKMADAGLVENTETNRREFINQVGQYNKRAQGDLRRLARDSGFGPFATAGTTFNTLGLRTATMSPGVKATSTMAAATLRANVMAKWVGAFTLVGTLNYLLTKDKGGGVMGRAGVPVGRIDTGLNDKNKRPLSIPVFDILGLGRALRVTGARGALESYRKGLPMQNAFDAASRDIVNTNISPFLGPVARFGFVAASGYQPAINVGRVAAIVPPGESQARENLKQAIVDANPLIKSFALSREPGGGTSAAIRQQIPRISLQPSQSADFMAHYPEIVHKAQAREYINDVIGRARKMEPAVQRKFVQDALKKLTPEDQEHAQRTLKYSRILF